MKATVFATIFVILFLQFDLFYCIDNRESNAQTIKLITRLCQSMPGESVICKRYSEPVETIFAADQAIYHYRSERDNSESLFPKNSENDLSDD
uniref:Uncharacterized protein n=1 Tax=Panagrolaimus superbus TaxID=310955 RepID=A0A914Z7L0_9BILA